MLVPPLSSFLHASLACCQPTAPTHDTLTLYHHIHIPSHSAATMSLASLNVLLEKATDPDKVRIEREREELLRSLPPHPTSPSPQTRLTSPSFHKHHASRMPGSWPPTTCARSYPRTSSWMRTWYVFLGLCCVFMPTSPLLFQIGPFLVAHVPLLLSCFGQAWLPPFAL